MSGWLGRVGLEAACARAVRNSKVEASALAAAVAGLTAALAEPTLPRWASANDAVSSDRRLTTELVGELAGAVGRRMANLDTFNITLFGRTGVGKSSLLEALTHGDGGPASDGRRRISDGGSDWTTTLDAERLGTLRVVDTPGIDGWGRTKDPALLRRTALDALASSDLVLLCFDTFNQRASEFETVAEWIARYRRPVVAVVNVRNEEWPARNADPGQRRQAFQTVRQHVDGRVGPGLAEIGLAGTPIVAVGAKNAVFARAGAGYRGRYPEGCSARIARAGGTDALLDWSNLGALEELVAQLVTESAVDLRLSAVREQVASSCRRARTQWQAANANLTALVEPAELGLTRILELLGSPAALARSGSDDDRRELSAVVDGLAALERLRGAPIPASPRGTAMRHAESLIAASAGRLRAEATARAERLIDNAMANNKRISEKSFRAAVFRDADIAAAVEDVAKNLNGFVSQNLDGIAADVRSDLSAVTRLRSVRGGKGRVRRWAGVATSMGGIGVGLFSVALANAWNPFGWGLAVAAGAYVLVGASIGFLGDRMRRSAAHRRERELAEMRAHTRRSVNQVFDQLSVDITDNCRSAIRRLMSDELTDTVRNALAWRCVIAANDTRVQRVTDLLASLPPTPDPRIAIRRAVAAAERARGADRAPEVLWLAERFADASTARVEHDDDDVGPPRRPDVRERVTTALTVPGPGPGAGKAWLARYQDSLRADPGTAPIIDRLVAISRSRAWPPKVVFCGDYSTGKSTLIRRLHHEAGLPAPAGIAIGGDPTSDAVAAYPWHGFQLVDTPGFQSAIPEHAARAHAAIAEASVLIYLFNGAGVGSDVDDLRAVLGVPLPARLLPVLARADSLGVDPRDAPRGFAALCERKEEELLAALRRVLGPERRLPSAASISAAPFENRRSAPWDGIAEFSAALLAQREHLHAQARDTAVLGAAIHHLTGLAESTKLDAELLPARIQRMRRRREALVSAAKEADALLADRRSALRRGVTDFIAELVRRTLATPDKDARKAVLRRLALFAQDDELNSIVDQWRTQTERSVADLVSEARAVLDGHERAAAADAGAAVGSEAVADPAILDLGSIGDPRHGRLGPKVANFLGAAGKLEKLGKVAAAGTRLGRVVKFAGPVALTAGAAWSVWDLVDEVRRRPADERHRAALILRLQNAATAWADDVCAADPSVRRLTDHHTALLARTDGAVAELAAEQARGTQLEFRIRLCEAAAGAAVRIGRGENE